MDRKRPYTPEPIITWLSEAEAAALINAGNFAFSWRISISITNTLYMVLCLIFLHCFWQP